MKKTIAFLCMITVCVSFLPRVAHATIGGITIDGVVSEKGKPVVGYRVIATCVQGSAATTDVNGYYAFHVTEAQCPIGTNVVVRADKDLDGRFIAGASGVISLHTTLNIKLEDFYNVPEYGWLGGLTAAGVGLVAIVFARVRFVKVVRS